MGTNEELRDATEQLTREVHDLSGRLSAKELLHKRTRRLTLLSLSVAAISMGAILMVYSVARNNKDNNAYWSGCFARWGAAASERQDVLNDASKEVAEKKGAADRAMRILVDYRGDPNNAITDQAKLAYGVADDARIAAEVKLEILREQYPPPLIENFCTRMKKGPEHPKAQRE